MNKINFDVDYFKNNKVAINCKTLDEVEQFKEMLINNGVYVECVYNGFERYGKEVCYRYDNEIYENDKILFGSEYFYKNENYEILDFTGFCDTQFYNKTTILTEDIELKNGDIINTKDYGYGIVINDMIIYTNSNGWDDKEDIINNITEYLPFDILKQQSFYEEDKGILIQNLLFDDFIEDNIKSLMIKVEKPIPKIKTKIYHIGFNTHETEPIIRYVSNDNLSKLDICVVENGLSKGKYARIMDITEEYLVDEEIKSLDKIGKIK